MFKDLSKKEKAFRQKEKPLYGRIICKCEHITEQEIVDAIKGPLGSQTIKGIKKELALEVVFAKVVIVNH